MKTFRQQIGLKFKEGTSEVLHLELSFYGVENCTLRKVDRKYLGSFKCCAGEEWRRSGGRIVWEIKFNVELRRTDVAYIQ